MHYQTIHYQQSDSIVTITWNRPEVLNAISPELEQEFQEACWRANADPSVRAVVVQGAGRCFSSGYDIAHVGGQPTAWPGGMPEGMDSGEWLENWRRQLARSWAGQIMFADMDKPVIAAVHSWCIGGGTWYVFNMDIVIAADDAVFGQSEIRNVDSGSFVWAARAGWGNALRYALTGDHIDAQEALRIGLVNEVVPREKLEEHTMALARRLTRLPADAVRLNKLMIRRGMDMMGYRNAHMYALEVSTLCHSSRRQDPHKKLEEAAQEGGLRAYLKMRDDPFRPEPFGPRSQAAGG